MCVQSSFLEQKKSERFHKYGYGCKQKEHEHCQKKLPRPNQVFLCGDNTRLQLFLKMAIIVLKSGHDLVKKTIFKSLFVHF